MQKLKSRELTYILLLLLGICVIANSPISIKHEDQNGNKIIIEVNQ